MTKKDDKAPAAGENEVIARNRKAFHDYEILESVEAGIELCGTEVKSCRMRSVALNDAYAKIENGELFVFGLTISPYSHGNRFNHDSVRRRRLLMHRKEIYGILELPEDFSKRINRGEQAHAGLYCDMAALLNYKALLQATSDVAALMNAKIQVEGLPYASKIQQEITAAPVEIREVKMFNPQSGFTSFIIPAVLILVIQQSLLLGAGTITGTLRDKHRALVPGDSHYRHAWSIVAGRGCAYLPVYFVMAYWVLFVVPRLFGMTQIGVKADLLLFLFPFLLACIFLAIACSFLCREREYAFLIFVFTSVPLMFISGISWPREGIPEYWLTLAKIFPSTHGIDGFVKINNMGATLPEVLPEYASLWFLAAVYFGLACFLYRKEIVKRKYKTVMS